MHVCRQARCGQLAGILVVYSEVGAVDRSGGVWRLRGAAVVAQAVGGVQSMLGGMGVNGDVRRASDIYGNGWRGVVSYVCPFSVHALQETTARGLARGRACTLGFRRMRAGAAALPTVLMPRG